MKYKFINKKINYDGSQLKPHWIFEETSIIGDAIVSFIGSCNVKPQHMVDMADKKAGCKIYSEKMLNFIVEHFDSDLEKMILRQRIFVSILASLILSLSKDEPKIIRKGNDLFDKTAKLNVSIATASSVSCLMHAGINISSKNTPVLTKGLEDYKINPKTFAQKAMLEYIKEMEGVKIARCKVKPL